MANADADHSLLVEWLTQHSYRAARQFLLEHPELLAPHIEQYFAPLYQMLHHDLHALADVQRRALILRDARHRGEGSRAIEDACINYHGGFCLDVPPWLDQVDHADDEILARGMTGYAARERADLWRAALTRSDARVPQAVRAAMQIRQSEALLHVEGADRLALDAECVHVLQLAAQVLTRERYPYQWAYIQNNLGQLDLGRSSRDERADFVPSAIRSFEAALAVYQDSGSSLDVAIMQYNLAGAYSIGGKSFSDASIEQALKYIEAALRVLDEQNSPVDWANAQMNRGGIFAQRSTGDEVTNTEEAIAAYGQALRVFTYQGAPDTWANIQFNLAMIYAYRNYGERSANIDEALRHYQAALRFFSPAEFPLRWAQIKRSMGWAHATFFAMPFAPARAEHIAEGLLCLQDALSVFTPQAMPLEWAETQLALGGVYFMQLRGDREENLRLARQSYEQALRIYTRASFPLMWAQLQRNIADTYREAQQPQRNKNLVLAAQHYRAALEVDDFASMPTLLRSTSQLFAEVLTEQRDWRGGHDAYQQALAAESSLLAASAGIAGVDVVLKGSRYAANRDAYALIQLKSYAEAATVAERGRAHVLIAAHALTAADPMMITSPERQRQFIAARARLVDAQHALTMTAEPADQIIARPRTLALNHTYQNALQHFHQVVAAIQAEGDPPDFLQESFDIETIGNLARQCTPGHALVYVVPARDGGAAIAVVGGSQATHTHAMLLPECTEKLVNDLIFTYTTSLDSDYLDDVPPRLIGGLGIAQAHTGLLQLVDHWPSATLAGSLAALQAAARHARRQSLLRQSLLGEAVQEALRDPRLAPLQHHKNFMSNDTALVAQLKDRVDIIFLQRELRRALDALGNAVLRPLAMWLKRLHITSLTLIPCGGLDAFPLLSVALKHDKDPARWQTFGEAFVASIVPAARLLHGAPSGVRTGVYALGDSRRDLPWGEAEARSVANLAQRLGLTGQASVQNDATLATFRAYTQQAYVLDVACHGSFDRQQYLDSQILLAAGTKITLREILSQDVDLSGMRLLMLSACETGIFEVRGSMLDEVRSLATGLLQTGIRAVLASQWTVNDHATYLLMVRFAQEWLPHMHHEPPAAALARAQRWLRRLTFDNLRTWKAAIPIEEPSYRAPQESGALGRNNRYAVGVAEAKTRALVIGREPTIRPYTDPFFWAGFQVIGW